MIQANNIVFLYSLESRDDYQNLAVKKATITMKAHSAHSQLRLLIWFNRWSLAIPHKSLVEIATRWFFGILWLIEGVFFLFSSQRILTRKVVFRFSISFKHFKGEVFSIKWWNQDKNRLKIRITNGWDLRGYILLYFTYWLQFSNSIVIRYVQFD